MVAVTPLESLVARSPAALRLLDAARGRPVTGGLTVVARPVGEPNGLRTARRSPASGIYGWPSLPGLGGFQRGQRPATEWCADPFKDEQANFVVSLSDRSGRFLPQTLLLCLPKERLLDVPLFSSPARQALAGFTIVRGLLRQRQGEAPAAWARVSVSSGSATWTGITDERGVFAVLVPFQPAPLTLDSAEPDGGLVGSVSLQVFHQPARLRFAAEVDPASPPDTQSILQQDLAVVFDTEATSGPTLVRPLEMGRPLAVTTVGQSRVLVESAP